MSPTVRVAEVFERVIDSTGIGSTVTLQMAATSLESWSIIVEVPGTSIREARVSI